MPLLILSKADDKLPPSMKKKAYAFLEKLQKDDSLPGLHIEKIVGSVDDRVRTGRVDDNYRAVLFKLTGTTVPTYVVHGMWPHDQANQIAESVRLSVNAVNGVPQVDQALQSAAVPAVPGMGAAAPAPLAEPRAGADFVGPTPAVFEDLPAPSPATAERPMRWDASLSPESLHEDLGLDADLARRALGATTEALFMEVISEARPEWQSLALLSLATGASVPDVRRDFGLDRKPPVAASPAVDGLPTGDQHVLDAMRSPAARVSFHVVDGQDDLRQIIECGDFGAWRLFLHPQQRVLVTRDFSGPARISGGAGTGKTVVTVHRAQRLHRGSRDARILLTTYTKNLADDLKTQVHRLDEATVQTDKLNESGVHVRGIDSLAWTIMQRAGSDIAQGSARVFGTDDLPGMKSTPDRAWQEAIVESGANLPPHVATRAFFVAEYGLVVLPQHITSGEEYARAKRAGRGVTLGRVQRGEVWKVVETYRAKARVAGTTDYDEKAALAAAWLKASDTTYFDHVLVDEAQDLTPEKFMLLRAVVAPGQNDLFLAEDSHQRIYGNKVTLKDVGIKVVGRATRLALNYRTTAQNLDWAMRILDGGDFTDLDGEAESHGYRSARTGPVPHLVSTATMNEQLDRACELVAGWLAGDAPGSPPTQPETIAVLVRDSYRRDTVVTGLQERGLDVRSVDRENPRPGKPLVMTMHRAKGLEFTHVLLFDVAEGAIPRSLKEYDSSPADKADALLRERSLVYVAATRARDVLAVSWSGERSSLIAGL